MGCALIGAARLNDLVELVGVVILTRSTRFDDDDPVTALDEPQGNYQTDGAGTNHQHVRLNYTMAAIVEICDHLDSVSRPYCAM